ncbi:DUF456 domain-containing protein [Candidatus Woesearchaeota archaeon]|nr:DUF456 domain-containing protein [Candidatus Woesearchaeota archaeon]
MIAHWIGLTVFILFAFVGILLTMMGIMGTFSVFIGAAAYDLITWSWTISWQVLLVILGLAILGEILEWVVDIGHSKAKGVSTAGTVGSITGTIVGAIIFSPLMFIVGTVIGMVLGAVVGAYIGELIVKKNSKKAWRAAKVALVGRALVAVMKTMLAIIQIWVTISAIF